MEEWFQNTRGLIIVGLAIATCAILLAVDPGNGFPNGVAESSGGSSPTTVVTTPPSTTKPGTGTGTTTTTVGKPILQQGSSGADVTNLQTRLTALGYSVTADGDFGAGTQEAVIAFQTKKGISPADGVVNQATWSALDANP